MESFIAPEDGLMLRYPHTKDGSMRKLVWEPVSCGTVMRMLFWGESNITQLRDNVLKCASDMEADFVVWQVGPTMVGSHVPRHPAWSWVRMYKVYDSFCPRNNDGRKTCFWCGAPTKRVPGIVTNVYDICTKCGR